MWRFMCLAFLMFIKNWFKAAYYWDQYLNTVFDVKLKGPFVRHTHESDTAFSSDLCTHSSVTFLTFWILVGWVSWLLIRLCSGVTAGSCQMEVCPVTQTLNKVIGDTQREETGRYFKLHMRHSSNYPWRTRFPQFGALFEIQDSQRN